MQPGLGDSLVVAYAVEPPFRSVGDEWREAQRALEELGRPMVDAAVARAAEAGVEAEAVLVPKRPADALLALAAERDARMIVVGSASERPLTGLDPRLGAAQARASLERPRARRAARRLTPRQIASLQGRTPRYARPVTADAATADVRLENVVKRFDGTVAVDGISVEIPRGSFFALLGPSGCGKTTTLRMIGGFEEPTEGRIFLGDQDVVGLPPYKRDVNTVFQSYALFPHMSIEDNVAFGLERKGVAKERAQGPGRRDARARRPRPGSRSASRGSSRAASSSASRSRARS